MAVFQSKSSFWNKNRNTYEYYLSGSSSLNEVLDMDKDASLLEIRLHLDSAATQEQFTISLNSGKGSEFNVVLFSYDMSYDIDDNPGVVTDLVWRPTNPIRIGNEDTVSLSWANTDGATWGLSVIVEQ